MKGNRVYSKKLSRPMRKANVLRHTLNMTMNSPIADPLLHEVVERVKSGNTLLFCGAGFSRDAKNIQGRCPPLAGELALQICRLGALEEDEDLMYASGKYMDTHLDEKSCRPLIDLLNNVFDIQEASQAMGNICSYRYRRIYTTNYDDAIEIASKNAGVHREAYSVLATIKIRLATSVYCI